jgi:hypothetical protein
MSDVYKISAQSAKNILSHEILQEKRIFLILDSFFLCSLLPCSRCHSMPIQNRPISIVVHRFPSPWTNSRHHRPIPVRRRPIPGRPSLARSPSRAPPPPSQAPPPPQPSAPPSPVRRPSSAPSAAPASPPSAAPAPPRPPPQPRPVRRPSPVRCVLQREHERGWVVFISTLGTVVDWAWMFTRPFTPSTGSKFLILIV